LKKELKIYQVNGIVKLLSRLLPCSIDLLYFQLSLLYGKIFLCAQDPLTSTPERPLEARVYSSKAIQASVEFATAETQVEERH
jgi:hypothetical protein